jgi:PadR family transcriptional regulator, regulatory protein PadR
LTSGDNESRGRFSIQTDRIETLERHVHPLAFVEARNGPRCAICHQFCYDTPLDIPKERSEVLQGTLDLMVLKTLEALGPLHGYGIARRLEQLSDSLLRLNEGTVYAALLRLAQKGWIHSEWGESENRRKARFYSITKAGRKQLDRETESWERVSGVIGRVLRLEMQT